ncbi:hypothetical protein BH759_11985 [Ralstonia solanacearum]|nr:hypothetical protein BH759_11985 [Ralstonia solanacearum]
MVEDVVRIITALDALQERIEIAIAVIELRPERIGRPLSGTGAQARKRARKSLRTERSRQVPSGLQNCVSITICPADLCVSLSRENMPHVSGFLPRVSQYSP